MFLIGVIYRAAYLNCTDEFLGCSQEPSYLANAALIVLAAGYAPATNLRQRLMILFQHAR